MEWRISEIRMAGDFMVKPGTVLGPRQIDEYELVFFPDASSTIYTVNSCDYAVTAPSVICTKPGETHAYLFDPNSPTRHLFAHFTLCSPTAAALTEAEVLPPPLVAVTDAYIIPALFRHLLSLLHDRPVDHQIRSEQLLTTIITEVNGISKQGESTKAARLPSKIVQALNYIEVNLRNSITVEDIALAVEWSPEHLTRNMTKSVGLPPQRVIRQLRIRRACQLLCQSKLTIAEIAHMVGYEDENYFSRVFHKEKQITASKFRDQYSDPRYEFVVQQPDYLSPYPMNQYLTWATSEYQMRPENIRHDFLPSTE